MKVSAFFLSPWKRGGSLPMALTLAAAAIGCATAPPVVAGPPPGGPPPGALGGFPPVPPPCSPIATFRSSSSSASMRGCCGATAAVGAAWVTVWVVVWVVVIVVPVILCERSLFAIAKNGVIVTGVVGARGSFNIVGLLWMVISRGSGSVSDSLLRAQVGI